MSEIRGTIALPATNVVLNGRAILNEVAFEANAGDVHCVIGPNGSGKSTLLRVLAGDIPTEKLTVDGINMKKLSTSERARHRSVLRATIRPDFPYSVFDVVSWALLGSKDSDQNAASRRVHEALNQVGIAELAQRPVNQLSTGQITKVNIASVVLQKAGIVLADEPEAALDPVARVEAWRHLTAGDFTTVIATHSLDLVQEFGTHVTAIKNGRIQFSGPLAQLTISDLSSVYLP